MNVFLTIAHIPLYLFLPLRRTVSPYTLNTVTHIQWRVLNYNGWWNKADINTSSKPVVSYSRWSTSPLLASYSHLYRRFVNTLFSWESFWNTHPKTTGSLFSYIHYHSKVWKVWNYSLSRSFSCIENYEVTASVKFCAAFGWAVEKTKAGSYVQVSLNSVN